MTLMITVNILLVLNVSAFFTTIAEAVILILAVLGSSIGKQSAAHHCARYASRWFTAWRTGTRASNDPGARRVKFEVENFRPIENTELKGRVLADWIERNREWVKYVVPAYLLFFAVIVDHGRGLWPGCARERQLLYELADADALPGDLGTWARRGDPDGRTRSFRALAHHAVGRVADRADAWRQRSRGMGRAAGARRGLARRRLQRRGRGRARLAADCGHARCQRPAAGHHADLLQRLAARLGAIGDQQFHERALRSLVACRVVRAAVPCVRVAVAASHGVWTTRLCRRQFADRGEAFGRARGRNA